MKKFFVIDMMPFLYRGHFVFMRNPRITAGGFNTSALFGFANSLLSILSTQKPDCIAIAAEGRGRTFRHEIYPSYKAGRDKMPEDVAAAIPLAAELASILKIPVVSVDGVEADDIIGTLSRLGAAAGLEVFMVTPDKDAAQLVGPGVKLYRPGKGGDAPVTMGVEEVKAEWGLSCPAQMIDYLALAGDAVDNVPGIRGIGSRTAQTLLAEYPDTEALIAAAPGIPGKLGEKIRDGIENLRLSRRLVEIRTDVPIPFDPASFVLKQPDFGKLAAFCKTYELSRLANAFIPRTQGGGFATARTVFGQAANPAPSCPASQNRIIAGIDGDTVAELAAAPKLAFAIEDAGEDGLAGAPKASIAFSAKEGVAYHAPFSREIFEKTVCTGAKTLVTHDAKAALKFLEGRGIAFAGVLRDTMLEHYVLDAAARHTPDVLARELLGTELPRTGETGVRAAHTAAMILQWDAILRKKVLEAGAMASLRDAEEPLVPILLEMERLGVKFDISALGRLGVELGREAMRLMEEIHAVAGEAFNIDSPKQLGDFLFGRLGLAGGRKTATGQFSTDEKTLLKLVDSHEVVRKILDYRAVVKLKNTYVDKLPRLAGPDGRVHTTFTQAFTETGRLSSVNPNLQNIPVRRERGRPLRAAVVPGNPSKCIVSADYSQIELRIMASMSGDENMIAAFNSGADIHRDTAARVYGVMDALVTDDMRSRCKMVNFGIIYGISAFGLAERLNIPRKEAASLIETYFRMYPKIKAFMEALVAKAREKGYAQTLLGRRRSLPEISSRSAATRQAAERDAINTPIQGTAADLIKLAMVKVRRALKAGGFKTRMILQIHDELLFEAPKDELAAVVPVIKREMENALEIGIPLEVSIGVGDNWLEAH